MAVAAVVANQTGFAAITTVAASISTFVGPRELAATVEIAIVPWVGTHQKLVLC